jgi:MFS family permease
MMRIGTRVWLGFLLVAWGAVAACFSLVSSAATFYAMRALLGAFEAGAFPAMWAALSTFFPRSRWAGSPLCGAGLRWTCFGPHEH